MSHLIVGGIGLLAGILTAEGIRFTVRKLGQKLGWKNRYRPHRYEEIL